MIEDNKNYTYIYVLDYCCNSITLIKTEINTDDILIEELLNKFDIDSDNCSWLISDVELEIGILTDKEINNGEFI